MSVIIIIDLNQVMFSSFFASVGKHTNVQIEEKLIRHMALNTIRSLNVKFRSQYGNLVIASDSKKYWRKEVFPYYKASRKKLRDASDVDWPSIFSCMDLLKGELRNHFPYKYIEVEGAEADDIIGTICLNNFKEEDILIVSGDKDYLQLQKNPLIKQYDPVNKKFLTCDDPQDFLHRHIIRGDSGDGIPNVKSDDNCFVIGKRQKNTTEKLINELQNINEENEHWKNYQRNKMLIDLSQIPQDIQSKILEEFEKDPIVKDRSGLMKYFAKNKLMELTENLSDF